MSDRSQGESGKQHAAAGTGFPLGRSSEETARLQRQAEELAPVSRVLLERTALGPGQHVIDVGCGPRGVLEQLVEYVGPGGRVVGLDSDPTLIELFCALVRHYQQPATGFVARLRPGRLTWPGDYDHLSRKGEWADGDAPDRESAGHPGGAP